MVRFRVHPPAVDDEEELRRLNAAVLDRVNASGKAFLSLTKLQGRCCLRVAVGNLQTSEREVRRAFEPVCRRAGLAADCR